MRGITVSKFTKTPILVLFLILGISGISTAYAAITITLSGDVIVTDDLTVIGDIFDGDNSVSGSNATAIGGTGNTTDAENDINNTFVDTAVSGNVLTNDADAEGDTQTVTTTTVTTVQGVTVTIDPTTGAYEYTPPAEGQAYPTPNRS